MSVISNGSMTAAAADLGISQPAISRLLSDLGKEFNFQLFDKRDEFPFSIVRMPDLSGNLPSFIFYGSIMSEFLRIARCTRLVADFLPRAQALCKRMISQGGYKNLILKQIRKAITRHPEPFKKFTLSPIQIIQKLS